MSYEEQRNNERLEDLDVMFTFLRRQKRLLTITNRVYNSFKETLILVQKNQIKMRKLI